MGGWEPITKDQNRPTGCSVQDLRHIQKLVFKANLN